MNQDVETARMVARWQTICYIATGISTVGCIVTLVLAVVNR